MRASCCVGREKAAAQRRSAARSAPAAAAPAAGRVASPASDPARRTATASRPDPELGAYDASTASRGFVVHDANSWAVYYGVADADQAAQIVQTMADTLTTDYGLRAAEAGVPRYPQIVSPFISSFSLPANYLAGRPDLATQQMLATWGYMVDTDAGSTTWERINLPGGNLAGTIPYLFGDSASHAWSTGATSSLSDYVLGITPTSVAYRTWQVKPFPVGLTFAQGRVPTTAGAIASRWELGEDAFRITVEAPDGTSGTVAVPTLGSSRVIFRDGVEVWDGTAGVGGIDAVATADGYVAFRNVTGTHTWAWSSP
ncbi:MAG: alpha-L-rhamnosidase C-terminal domain-containing protein [Mycobacterium sp.]